MFRRESQKMNKLKPCPFCGSNEISGNWENSPSHVYWTFCEECYIKTSYFNSIEKSNESWNRRAPIKWPTNEEVLIGADEKIVGIYGYGPYGDDVQVYRRAWVECFEWLKSFIEEENDK